MDSYGNNNFLMLNFESSLSLLWLNGHSLMVYLMLITLIVGTCWYANDLLPPFTPRLPVLYGFDQMLCVLLIFQ